MEKMDKIDKVVNLIREMNKERFTGCVKIFFSQGGVTQMEKIEEMLKRRK